MRRVHGRTDRARTRLSRHGGRLFDISACDLLREVDNEKRWTWLRGWGEVELKMDFLCKSHRSHMRARAESER
jgi:hypothetical protein